MTITASIVFACFVGLLAHRAEKYAEKRREQEEAHWRRLEALLQRN